MAGFNGPSVRNILHFSHPHCLDLTTLVGAGAGAGEQYYCRGCIKSVSNGLMVYQCRPCSFYLHLSCSQIPRQINHPADNHVLNLLSRPRANGDGICSLCNACGQEMRHGFSFHCSVCDLDLHPSCANLPMKFHRQDHPHHTLFLSFTPPYPGKAFICDVCKERGEKSWHYHCSQCFFDAHVTCTQISSIRERLTNRFLQNYRGRSMGMGSHTDIGNPIRQILENRTQRRNQILENYIQGLMGGGHMPTTSNPLFTGYGYLGRSYSQPLPRLFPLPRPSMYTNSSSFHVHQQQQQTPFPPAQDNMNANMFVEHGMDAIMQNAMGGTPTNFDFMNMIGSGIPGGDVSGLLENLSGIIGSMFGFGFF